MNRLRAIEEYIKKEHTNLIKSVKRSRSPQGIIEKTETLNDLINEYKLVLNKNRRCLSDKQWNDEVEIYQALKVRFHECSKILENTQVSTKSKHSLKSVTNSIIFCKRISGKFKPWVNTHAFSITSTQNSTETQIATMPSFDVKSATAIVQPYDGSHDALNTFVDSANLLKELTSEEHMAVAIRFIKTRLTGKARLGLPDVLNSIDELINDVKTRCKGTVTSESIVAKLKGTKQRGDTEKFCNTIEYLCNQLQATYVEIGVPAAVAKQMATKAGVEALTSGVSNNETRIILKAGTFADVNQAIQKVTENATTNNDTQILAYKANPRHTERNHFSNQTQNRFQNYNRNRYGFRNQGYRQQQPHYRNNFNGNYPRNQQFNRNDQFNNHFRQANRGRGSQNNSRHVYTTTVETNQPRITPTQMQQPHQMESGENFLGSTALRANQGQYMQ